MEEKEKSHVDYVMVREQETNDIKHRNMKSILSFSTVLGLILLTACGNSSNRNSYENNPLDEYSISESEEDNYRDEEPQLVTCPMCNGTGIFDFMPGDMMAPKQTCSACNGNGVCDVNTAQQVMQAKAQVDAMMGGGGSADGYNSGGSGREAYQIEYELNKAYELLEGMQQDYENCSSGVIRAQYPRMIAEQKERIRQLEAELRNAQ